jgi:hypothetical protein
MNIIFTSEQEHYIQRKLQSGKYHSTAEVLSVAFQLLDDYDLSNSDSIGEIPINVIPVEPGIKDSLTKLFGCIKTDIHDIADNHDHYVGESLYQDLHFSE